MGVPDWTFPGTETRILSRRLCQISEGRLRNRGTGSSRSMAENEAQDIPLNSCWTSRIECPSEMVSKITDKILPEIRAWQSRPADRFTLSCSLTASTTRSGRYGLYLSRRAAYVVLEVTTEGAQGIPQHPRRRNTKAQKFWLVMLSISKRTVEVQECCCLSLSSRGRLPDFKEAIQAPYFPQSEIQRCVITLLA